MSKCYECNITGAAAAFYGVCRDRDLDCREIDELLEREAGPQEWIDGLAALRDRHDGKAREAFDAILSKLCGALEGSEYRCEFAPSKGAQYNERKGGMIDGELSAE